MKVLVLGRPEAELHDGLFAWGVARRICRIAGLIEGEARGRGSYSEREKEEEEEEEEE